MPYNPFDVGRQEQAHRKADKSVSMNSILEPEEKVGDRQKKIKTNSAVGGILSSGILSWTRLGVRTHTSA